VSQMKKSDTAEPLIKENINIAVEW